MANAIQYLRLTGQVKVSYNGIPLLTASRISMRINKPISKQKSATTVGVAEGIPDPSGNMRLMPGATGSNPSPESLVLMEGGGTLVLEKGNEKYQVSGVVFTEANMDNDPGVASLENTAGWEGALVKRIA